MSKQRKSIIKFLFMIFTASIFLTACSDSAKAIEKNVSLSVKEDTISPTGLTLVMKNNSFNSYMYGEDYSLRKEIDGTWTDLPMIVDEALVILIGHRLNVMSSNEVIIDWEDWYGQLDPGRYLILKTVSSMKDSDIEANVMVAFEISE